MRRLAYLFLLLIIVACAMRETIDILEISQPKAEGFMGILYTFAFYGRGDIYHIINYGFAVGSLMVISVIKQIGKLAVGKVDVSSLDMKHLDLEKNSVEAFQHAFPHAKIKEA